MPKGGKEAFLSKVTFRRESNWYSNTKQMLKDMKTTEEIIQEILDEQHEMRWMDTSDLEVYLRKVAETQKAIDTEKAIEWLKANAHKYIVDIAVVQWERNLIVGGCCWNDLRKAMED